MKSRAVLLKQISESWDKKWTSADKVTIFTLVSSIAHTDLPPDAFVHCGEPCLKTLHYVIKHTLNFCTEQFDTFHVLISPFVESPLPDSLPIPPSPEANPRKRVLDPQAEDFEKRRKSQSESPVRKRRADDDVEGESSPKQRRFLKETSPPKTTSSLTCFEKIHYNSDNDEDDSSASNPGYRGITV